MMRLDAEITYMIRTEDEEKLLSCMLKIILKRKNPHVIILKIITKGVLTETCDRKDYRSVQGT